MDKRLYAAAIDHLDQNGYEELFYYLLKKTETFCGCKRLEDIDERIIENPPERFSQTAETFFLTYFPYSLYKDFTLDSLNLKELEMLVESYFKKRRYDLWLPIDGTAIYSISNYDSSKLGISDDELLQYYTKQLSSVVSGSDIVGIGNINTLINASNDSQNDYGKLIEKFFVERDDGICISFSEDKVVASHYIFEREFDGMIQPSHTFVHPVIKKINETDAILKEFNDLINSDCKESVLEEFLREHYKLIFGDNYDSISTQIWLDFPEFDVGNRERRADIMMRNSISDDWEIFELKRSNVRLTKTISDVPMFVSKVNDAIMQLKNYKKILQQDSVKKAFENRGIQYYNPEINLVIGRRKDIPICQWRSLIEEHDRMKILTYDDLYKQAQYRVNALKKLL